MSTATLPDVSAAVTQKPYEKVLIISDEHRGAKVSRFPEYQANLLAKMTEYDHVVELGDNVELFYIKGDHVADVTRLLDRVGGRGEAHWKGVLRDRLALDMSEAKAGKCEPQWCAELAENKYGHYDRVRGAIEGEVLFLEQFLEKFPQVKIHKVLGNHENVRRFRNRMDDVMAQIAMGHGNFEWSPEGVRIGDGLFTHGHLPIDQMTDVKAPQARLRDAHKKEKWRDLYATMHDAWHEMEKVRKSAKKAARRVHAQLVAWSGSGDFHYMHEGKVHDFSMDWVRHVFFGHTHVKFTHHSGEGKGLEPVEDGVRYHNSGAIVKSTAWGPKDLGILEAKLYPDGRLGDIREVEIEKDRQFISTVVR